VQNYLGRPRRFCSAARSHLIFSSSEGIEQRLRVLLEKKKVAGLIDGPKDSREVGNLIRQLRTAIVHYEVREIHVVETIIDTCGIAAIVGAGQTNATGFQFLHLADGLLNSSFLGIALGRWQETHV